MINSSPQETILSKATIQWSLSKAELVAQTHTSWLYKALQDNRKPVALKIFKPGAGDDERMGGRLLEWYGGEGAVTVHGYNQDCILMEWVEGHKLSEPATDGKDHEATIAIANLVSNLHKPRPNPPQGLMPLRARFKPLFSNDVRLWPDTARDLYARSVGIAYGVFDKPAAEVPLHGDVHHDNIVLAERGWVVLDPKGLLGDPAYDVANAFLNPWNEVKLAADPLRINAMANVFSQRLGFSRKRVLAFAAIHAALSACWDIEEGHSINWQLAVLPNLLAVYDAA